MTKCSEEVVKLWNKVAIDPSLLKGYACMKADKISLSDDKIYTETNLVSKLYSV